MPAEQTPARAGGCLCGAVRYEVRGPLRDVILCHCGQCRRWHGHLGASSSAARADVLIEDADSLVWFASSARGRRGLLSRLRLEPVFRVGRRQPPDDRRR
jgi:hypothetical protein